MEFSNITLNLCFSLFFIICRDKEFNLEWRIGRHLRWLSRKSFDHNVTLDEALIVLSRIVRLSSDDSYEYLWCFGLLMRYFLLY